VSQPPTAIAFDAGDLTCSRKATTCRSTVSVSATKTGGDLKVAVGEKAVRMSALDPIVLQNSIFADDQNSAGATFVYKMWGTSRPHAKFTGDFDNAIEVIRISDRSLLMFSRKILNVLAKNLEPCNFRLLQQYRPQRRHPGASPHRERKMRGNVSCASCSLSASASSSHYSL
jgi:hypothetical protein